MPSRSILLADLKRELAACRLMLADKRTPKLARWLLGMAIGYVYYSETLVTSGSELK